MMHKIIPIIAVLSMFVCLDLEAQGKPTNIMVVGDSISVGHNGGYRGFLNKKLKADCLSPVFVGPNTQGGSSDSTTLPHAAKKSKRIDWVSKNVESWSKVYKPEIIIIMIGTNDLASTNDAERAFQDMVGLLNVLYSSVDAGVIYLMPLPPMKGREDVVNQYNQKVDAYVSWLKTYDRSDESYKVHMLYDTSDVTLSDLNPDGVHLKMSGYEKIANQIYPSVKQYMEIVSIGSSIKAEKGCNENSD